ncbi:hypothetical protein GCM10027414_13290 [Humibacter ginsengiterrae]
MPACGVHGLSRELMRSDDAGVSRQRERKSHQRIRLTRAVTPRVHTHPETAVITRRLGRGMQSRGREAGHGH